MLCIYIANNICINNNYNIKNKDIKVNSCNNLKNNDFLSQTIKLRENKVLFRKRVL
ncbi:hypothetical protein BVAVS116_K0003 (plasmid) [Borreliella valaisiana VS116]|uniref:Uncharacterized protein n=1 Tax=Borreliella valaisiana VS116 TaxID=445987 RepID=C0R8J6_BORVA|nr:hypothetical protein BVAVS116_K0003 [Borreliella valaisiana VS116]